MYSMTGAILHKYVKGSLTENTGWSDLRGKMFSFAGKIFLQGLILVLGMIALTIILSILIGILVFLKNSVLVVIVIMIIIALLIALIPSLSLIAYPVFFEDASAWKGIKKSFRLGFKYWGSTFLTVFLGSLLYAIISYILAMPYAFYLMTHTGESGWGGYILALFSGFCSMVIYPIFIIFCSLQYTSIVENEEGISLQNKMEDFNNL